MEVFENIVFVITHAIMFICISVVIWITFLGRR